MDGAYAAPMTRPTRFYTVDSHGKLQRAQVPDLVSGDVLVEYGIAAVRRSKRLVHPRVRQHKLIHDYKTIGEG